MIYIKIKGGDAVKNADVVKKHQRKWNLYGNQQRI